MNKSVYKFIAVLLTLILTATSANSAWYSPPNSWFGSNCKEIPFDRASWGFNSQPIRIKILKEQARNPSRKFIGSTFVDEYTGDILELYKFNDNGVKISNADLDHVIPLNYMHKNGGCNWSSEKKKKFANDRINLKLIRASDNRIKGAKSPTQWLPYGQKAQANYLKQWNLVAGAYNAPTFKIKAFKVNNPKFVKYTKNISKGAGYSVAAAGLIFSGVGAAAILVPIGVEVVDEVIIISEDPDAYFSELATDFSTAYDTSIEWTSSSWDTTTEWTGESWNDASNWTSDSWVNVLDKTNDGWEVTKDYSKTLVDKVSGLYND